MCYTFACLSDLLTVKWPSAASAMLMIVDVSLKCVLLLMAVIRSSVPLVPSAGVGRGDRERRGSIPRPLTAFGLPIAERALFSGSGGAHSRHRSWNAVLRAVVRAQTRSVGRSPTWLRVRRLLSQMSSHRHLGTLAVSLIKTTKFPAIKHWLLYSIIVSLIIYCNYFGFRCLWTFEREIVDVGLANGVVDRT